MNADFDTPLHPKSQASPKTVIFKSVGKRAGQGGGRWPVVCVDVERIVIAVACEDLISS